MKFVPAATNPCHPDYERWDDWTKTIVQNLVLRWHSQGGTDHTNLQPWMVENFKYLLETMGDEISQIHEKAFKVLSQKNR